MKLFPSHLHLGLLLAASMIFASPLCADPVEEAVTAIRAKYNQIESASLTSTKIVYEPSDDPAFGTLTRYYSGVDLKKAEFAFGEGDHGGATEYYYYDGGQLVFAYVAQSFWRFTGNTMPNGESETIDGLIEHRLYFSDGALIRHLRKEVTSTDASALPVIIKHVKNQPFSDAELSSAVQMRGKRCMTVVGPADIEAIIYGE